jgi:putative SOS response-associated peptidase YedK
MKDSKWGIKNAVNARSETIFEKPTWQAAVRQRRCIVPVTAFYEQRDRRWARFTAAEGVLAIAGLFEDPNDYCHLRSFALITTTPNEQVSPYQDRMPVVLANEDIGMWLDPSTPVNAMKALFKPCPIFWTSVEDAGPTTRPKFVTALKEPSLFEE